MPAATDRPCGYPLCPALVSGKARYCVIHARDLGARPSAAERGYDARWRRFRAAFLRRYPLCGMRPVGTVRTDHSACQASGLVRAATVVDHITPVTGPDDPTFYQEGAHQALCETCHNRKRQQEKRS